VAVSAGTLGVISGQGEQVFSNELTHTQRKANSNGRASWEFTWRAPDAPGTYQLFGSGNSVNNNANQAGDRSSADTFAVEVVLPPATDTPTEIPATSTPTPVPDTPTQPIPTDTATAVATNTRRDTPTSTATRTVTPTPSPSASPTPTGPSPGDADCDGKIGAADLSVLLVQIAAEEGGACEFADADCDGGIDDGDLAATLARIFGGPLADACLSPP
jgi:hypothetical protein